MQELKDLSIVIRNLTQSRGFFQAGDQPRKERTVQKLEESIRRAIDAADALTYTIVDVDADPNEGAIPTAADSQAMIDFLPLRRDVLALFEQEKTAAAQAKEAASEAEAVAAK